MNVSDAQHIILVGTYQRAQHWCYENEISTRDRRLIFITSNDAVRHLRGVRLKEETTLVVDFYETGIGICSGEVHNEIRARYR